MREKQPALLERYDALFAASRVVVLDVSAKIVDRATSMRAKYGLKSPDAIHIATAVEYGASSFWTGDSVFARISEIAVKVLVRQANH